MDRPVTQRLLLLLVYTAVVFAAAWATASVGDDGPVGFGRLVAVVAALVLSAAIGVLGCLRIAAVGVALSFVFFSVIDLIDSDATLGWGHLWWLRVFVLLTLLAVVVLVAQAASNRRRQTRS